MEPTPTPTPEPTVSPAPAPDAVLDALHQLGLQLDVISTAVVVVGLVLVVCVAILTVKAIW